MKARYASLPIGDKVYYPVAATIEDTLLGYEDHGILTFFLYLDYGDGGHQGGGGYTLDSYDEARKERYASKYVGAVVTGILRTVGANSWEKLKGKTLLALKDSEKYFGGNIVGIMNLFDNDRYIIFEDLFKDE